MRAYISGKITTKQDFVLQNIWFANDEAEDTDIPSENCVGIEAENFETMFDETDPTVFHCRWKGVFLVTADEDGEETYTDDWTAADLVSLINEKNLTIRFLIKKLIIFTPDLHFILLMKLKKTEPSIGLKQL